MYAIRYLFTDSFMRNQQYWSVGYFTEAEPTMQHDGTWVEVDALPSSVNFAEVKAYVDSMNAPQAEEPATFAKKEITFVCYVEHRLLGYQLKYRRADSLETARYLSVREFLADCNPANNVTEADLIIQVSPRVA